MKQIEILILPDGQSRIVTRGFVGSSCRDATRELEQALGKRESEKLLPEFYQSDQQTNPQQERQ